MRERPRRAGVLLHPSSLPGPWGIGDFGADARAFIELLASNGQTLWQIMPLGPVGPGNSPYAARSTFAIEPLLVSPGELVAAGLLDQGDIENTPDFGEGHVDFEAVVAFKLPLLRKAHARFLTWGHQPEFEQFCAEAASWLEDYALFMALRGAKGWWGEWPLELRQRQPEAMAATRAELADEVRFQEFVQWCAYRQWWALRAYANQRGVQVVGDIPIFVDLDSSDAWANQGIFKLGATGMPEVVAGVPPDAFSATGQRWGNPVYDWEALRERKFDWWVERFRWTLRQVDIIRIDHFRGFESAWEVPAAEETAQHGQWVTGPGREVFDRACEVLGELPIVVEDLGLITDAVRELRDDLGYPGMDVLQFAFGDSPKNPYLPHNVRSESVMYTGTHDNDTTAGWLASMEPEVREDLERYMGHAAKGVPDIARMAYESVAEYVIIPMQDVLELGSEARMNVPGEANGNWTWRMTHAQLQGGAPPWLREFAEVYGRIPQAT
ncbi:MAG: 4-alpha-glucanotransferase [Dehalococcoidia bacterium]|nr:4-alpha-glucanotransferase [Dehalococcoidia bacterium]